MKQFFTILDKSLAFFIFLILFAMVVVVAANVFGRFILGSSISWGEEVAKMLLTYLTFFGAAYAMRDDSHYSFDFIIRKLPFKLLRCFLILRWSVVIIISVIVIYYSTEVTIRMKDWIMPSSGINRALVYGATPVGMTLLLIYSVQNLIEDIKNPHIQRLEIKD